MDNIESAIPDRSDHATGPRDAFQVASLLLVGDGMDARELAERLAPLAGGDVEGGLSKLHDMARQGLLRPMPQQGSGEISYIPTELGRDLAASVLREGTQSIQDLEALERMRSDLLAAIAHEFRTPLTAVRTAAGLLQDPGLPHDSPQERRLLQAISQSAEIMQRLVTDFLDLARFRAGAIDLEIRRFDARKLAQEAVASLAALFDSRRQEVVQPRGGRFWVYGDHRRLLQALINLLSNAHRFAPEGSTIYVTTEQEGNDVLWTVTDKGPGIPPEVRERLFDRYFSISRPNAEAGTGTGLGLPLALATAQAHGGTVDVASQPGEGSAFTLRIPVRPPEVRSAL